MNWKITNLLLVLTLLVSISGTAQELQLLDIDFTIDDQLLPQANIGGLNHPTFSKVDVNNDGISDLHIFDRSGDVQIILLNTGAASGVDYIFAPAYAHHFPRVKNLCLVRDYDNDGIGDLFTHSGTINFSGIHVYKGYYEQDTLKFAQTLFPNAVNNLLYYSNTSIDQFIYLSKDDLPAIDDIDGDGDLDIIAFGPGAGYVEYFQNQSVEEGWGLDSLVYIKASECWGGFLDDGNGPPVSMSDVPGECSTGKTGMVKHGAATLLTLDMDNDGDKELILGDLTFAGASYLVNGGTPQEAFINEQYSNFPPKTLAIKLSYLPGLQHLDINNDGRRDLMAAPYREGSENYRSGWYYENIGTDALPIFEFRQRDMFVEQMLDLGAGARPVFTDYNADGLLDLVVGTGGYFDLSMGRDARLFLFLNEGTAHAPHFVLHDEDWLNMSQYSAEHWSFTPTFGDLDGDGDEDLLIGEEKGGLYYAENMAGQDQPMSFLNVEYGYMGIDTLVPMGLSSVPQIIDLNRDGLLDLVIGERNGNLNYFQNQGTSTEPIFEADPELAPNNWFLGGVDVRITGQSKGLSSPFVFELQGSYQLLVGTELQSIKLFDNIEGNLNGTFIEQVSSLNDMNLGENLHPAIADINNDGFYDLMVGNYRGGLTAYSTSWRTDIAPPYSAEINAETSPTPTSNQLSVRLLSLPEPDQSINLTIFNTAGQLILNREMTTSQTSLQVNHYPPGVYILRLSQNDTCTSIKWVKD